MQASSTRANPVGVAVGALGAFAVVIGVFLPRVEAPGGFSTIAQNSLIQSGDGWLLIGLAVAVGGALYTSWNRGRSTWALYVLAALVIGIAVYSGTNKEQLTLYPLDQSGQPDTSAEGTTASPGVGIYAVGAGGLLVLFGAWNMRHAIEDEEEGVAPRRTARSAAPPPPPPPPARKRCPDCAEDVQLDARVCRFCGFRFDAAPAPPLASP